MALDYFACINRHLYNTDAVFLPISTNPDHSSLVSKILQEGIEDGWQYQPASFKTRPQYQFTKEQLCTLDTMMLLAWPGFKRRVFNSPIFHHMERYTMQELCINYGLHETEHCSKLSKLIPGHNQRCERMIGDLKRFKDIHTLISVTESRDRYKRIRGNLNKKCLCEIHVDI